jgi:hypothetical protein
LVNVGTPPALGDDTASLEPDIVPEEAATVEIYAEKPLAQQVA